MRQEIETFKKDDSRPVAAVLVRGDAPGALPPPLRGADLRTSDLRRGCIYGCWLPNARLELIRVVALIADLEAGKGLASVYSLLPVPNAPGSILAAEIGKPLSFGLMLQDYPSRIIVKKANGQWEAFDGPPHGDSSEIELSGYFQTDG